MPTINFKPLPFLLLCTCSIDGFVFTFNVSYMFFCKIYSCEVTTTTLVCKK